MPCLIVGDSLAVGVAQHRPDCVALAATGITSGGWLAKYGRRLDGSAASVVLISLGTNDGAATATDVNLGRLRARIPTSARVYWVMPPVNPPAQAAVRAIAAKHGDAVIYPSRLGPDGIHPGTEEYKTIAQVL